MYWRETYSSSCNNQVNIETKLFPKRFHQPDRCRFVKNWKGVDPISWRRDCEQDVAKASLSAKSRFSQPPSNSHLRKNICFEAASRREYCITLLRWYIVRSKTEGVLLTICPNILISWQAEALNSSPREDINSEGLFRTNWEEVVVSG